MEHSTPLRLWLAAPDVVPGNHLSPQELHGGWCMLHMKYVIRVQLLCNEVK